MSKKIASLGAVLLFFVLAAAAPSEVLSRQDHNLALSVARVEGAWGILRRHPLEFFQTVRFNNVRIVDGDNVGGWVGSDVGGWLNSAYADLPPRGGTIYYAPRADGLCANFSTPIIFNVVGKVATIQGLAPAGGDITNPGGSCINYVPTTNTAALTIDWTRSPVADNVPGGGLRDIALINNFCNKLAGCDSSAIGINCGPANGGCQMSTFFNVLVQGFHNCWRDNNAAVQTWGTDLTNSVIKNCAIGMNVLNAEESLVLSNSKIMLNGTGIQLNSVPVGLRISNSNFDGNTEFGVNGGKGCTISIGQTHFENLGVKNSHFVKTGCNLQINGGDAIDNEKGGNTDYWFSGEADVAIRDLAIGTAGRTVGNVVLVRGAGNMSFINTNPLKLSPCPTYAVSSICTAITRSRIPFLTSPIVNLGGVNQKGVLMGGASPSCTFTSGQGTGGFCTVATGSGNSFGTIIAKTGTGIASSGTLKLTFSEPLGTNGTSCVWMLSNGARGKWSARATVIDSEPSTKSDVVAWDNNNELLAPSTEYQFNYWCPGR